MACGFPPLPKVGLDMDSSDASVASDASAVDGFAGFLPLHIHPATLVPSAPDIIINHPQTVDTTALTIGGNSSSYFVRQDGYAVLLTASFLVESDLTIQGMSPLIVVATDRVEITANILASGIGAVSGPGAVTTGSGRPGVSVLGAQRESSGGGGGGYGTTGANGGPGSVSQLAGGTGGTVYGMNAADSLVGGSPGGPGGFATAGGGGGGGALQISTPVSIHLTLASINVGGGGGRGGGLLKDAGGGGGSGGAILLEAPMISLSSSNLFALGGGGGAGGCGDSGGQPGLSGQDGKGAGSGLGGAAGQPQGGSGGAGANVATGAVVDAQPGAKSINAGGGGGGAGRIWLRYRAATPPMGIASLPPPVLDPTLP